MKRPFWIVLWIIAEYIGVNIQRRDGVRGNQEDEEVLTLDEAAAFLKLHRRTVETMLLKDEDFPGKKVGRQWRIIKSDLIAYLRTSPTIPSPRSKRKGGDK